VFLPPPDTAEDLVHKYGITLEQAGAGSPDAAWLLTGNGGDAHLYGAGERLPIGAESFPGREPNDLVLWLESHRAVISGDTLVDFGSGLEIPPGWLRAGVERVEVVEGLRRLLSLPVEHVLATHGGPHEGSSLERALV